MHSEHCLNTLGEDEILIPVMDMMADSVIHGGSWISFSFGVCLSVIVTDVSLKTGLLFIASSVHK